MAMKSSNTCAHAIPNCKRAWAEAAASSSLPDRSEIEERACVQPPLALRGLHNIAIAYVICGRKSDLVVYSLLAC